MDPSTTSLGAPVVPRLNLEAQPAEAGRSDILVRSRTNEAATSAIGQLEVLFDPATEHVYVVEVGAEIANQELAAKIDSLRRSSLVPDAKIQTLSDPVIHGSNEQRQIDAEFARIAGDYVLDSAGKIVVQNDNGSYNLGISPDALKMLIRVSCITKEVAKDRIISIHERHTQGSHEFYQLESRSTEFTGQRMILHVHKGNKAGLEFGSDEYKGHRLGAPGAAGVAFKAFDLIGRQTYVVKESKSRDNVQDADLLIKKEFKLSRDANPSNTSPGLADRPFRVFNLQEGQGSSIGGIGLVSRFYQHGDLTRNIDSLTPKQRMEGMHALMQGVKKLNLESLVHLDIKSPNVFVTGHNELKIADFDGLWRVDDLNLFIGQIREHEFPAHSADSVSGSHIDYLIDLGKKIIGKNDEIRRLQLTIDWGESKKEKAQARAKLASCQEELKMLTQSYATACKFLHTRSVALLMLQIAVGKCIVSEKQVAELRGELSEKIRGCQDPDEKAYLIQIQSMINRQFENDLPKPSYNAQGVIQREAKEGITIDDLISVMESILDTYKSKPFAREQTAASAAAAVSGDQTASQPSTPRQRAKTIQ